jgi:phosphoserine phosphatase RsbU/P
MMTGILSTLKRDDPDLLAIREIVGGYAETHGCDAWFWRMGSDGWDLVAGTAERPQGPGPEAVPIRGAAVPSVVEVVGSHADDGPRSRFLAHLLSKLLRGQEESNLLGREIAERYEEITLLYSISEILGSIISLEEAAATILKEVAGTMGVRRAGLWLYESESESLSLVASVGGDGQQGPIRIDDGSSITASVFRERRAMILEPGEVFPREGAEGGQAHQDSFLAVPVSYTPPQGEPRTIGVINLVGRVMDEGFTAGDYKLISAIASQIGAAVENNRLVASSLRQERMVREMELAHDLQLKLLPSVSQFRDYADVAARCMPADSVGGDFYHLFRLPAGRFGVVIGDVSSHGFAAALIMALTMSAISIHASEGDAPADVLRRAHRALIDELETTEMYLTLFYAVIDPAGKKLTYANAGHPHAFRMSSAGAAQRLEVTNPPFGIIDLDDYGERTVEWEAATDLLFLFTDGLSDAVGTSDGERILVEHVAAGRDRALPALLDSLFEIPSGAGSMTSDDRTAVLVRI